MECKYKVGDIIEHDDSKFEILDIIKGNKNTDCKYKYKCLKCEYIGFKTSAKLDSRGCPCCSNKIIQKGINDIATTNPEMIHYFKNKEDVYKYGKGSHKKVPMICPGCKHEKKMSIEELFQFGFSCNKCSDGVSYPEKIMHNLLSQLNINFITQLSKKNFKWCEKYRYDFYFEYNNKKYIIETHGLQHYKKAFTYDGAKTLSEQIEIDKIKEKLAMCNGIDEYIIIDCRKSDLDWIKNNVLNSKLNGIFNLEDINWAECEKFAKTSFVIKVCEYWNKTKCIKYTCEKFNLSKGTVQRYLKIGTRLSLCDYDPSKGNQIKPKCSVKVICLNDGNIFDSIIEASKFYNIDYSSISKSCITGSGTQHNETFQDLYFMYYDEYINLSDEELKNIKKELEYKKYGHRIICLETGEKFNTYAECAKRFNTNGKSIKNICEGKVKYLKCGYTFKYIKDTI